MEAIHLVSRLPYHFLQELRRNLGSNHARLTLQPVPNIQSFKVLEHLPRLMLANGESVGGSEPSHWPLASCVLRTGGGAILGSLLP